jgi:hypothetical protein
MSKTISILIYTNSEYSFIWNTLFILCNKYIESNIDIHFLFEDTIEKTLLSTIPDNWIKHTYNEDMIWTDRILKALLEIKNDYILFLHEDWVPISSVKKNILDEMITFMSEKDCNFLVSFFCHLDRINYQEKHYTGIDNYYYIKFDGHIFQPAIWNYNCFIEFCSTLKKRKVEIEDLECQHFMNTKNTWSVQDMNSLKIRSINSLFYPHIHLLSQGLWNDLRYPNLRLFLENMGVDHSSRGTHPWWEKDFPEIIPESVFNKT